MSIWGPKRLQMEKVANYKVIKRFEIYNFGFGCYSTRGHLKKIEFQMWEFKHIFLYRWFQIKKVLTTIYKVVYLFEIYNFGFGRFSIWDCFKTQILLCSFYF